MLLFFQFINPPFPSLTITSSLLQPQHSPPSLLYSFLPSSLLSLLLSIPLSLTQSIPSSYPLSLLDLFPSPYHFLYSLFPSHNSSHPPLLHIIRLLTRFVWATCWKAIPNPRAFFFFFSFLPFVTITESTVQDPISFYWAQWERPSKILNKYQNNQN